MSDSNFSDPYASPTGPQTEGKPSFDMMHAFRHVFDNPEWITNLLLVLVCMFIPIIGPIVLLGYKFEMIDAWLDRPKAPYVNFDFGRFSEYLKRGVWPFLAAMIAQLLLTPLTFMFIMLPMMCIFPLFGSIMEQNDMQGVGVMCMLVGQLLLFVGIMAINVLAMCVITPIMLGAGISQEIGPAFDFSFVTGFISRTWKEMMMAYLWLMLATLVLTPVGLAFFCVGAYVVGAWAWMVMANVYYQLYALYLERGGPPIKPKANVPYAGQ